MTPDLFLLIAERFKALSEPARLQILSALQVREMSVGDLVEETGFGQANVSKHLQVLHAMGFVKRRKDGLYVYYALADRSVMKLCDLMCGRLETQLESQKKLLVGS
ncbi:MAG: metalloregulator ArsR/SmtB family transcription factor [Gemmatimonas sp.]